MSENLGNKILAIEQKDFTEYGTKKQRVPKILTHKRKIRQKNKKKHKAKKIENEVIKTDILILKSPRETLKITKKEEVLSGKTKMEINRKNKVPFTDILTLVMSILGVAYLYVWSKSLQS